MISTRDSGMTDRVGANRELVVAAVMVCRRATQPTWRAAGSLPRATARTSAW